jgi:hypothetical protein
MFGNTGMISIKDLFQSVMTSKVPTKRIYTYLLANAKYTYIQTNIKCMLTGSPLRLYKSEAIQALWFKERTWLTLQLQRKLVKFEHNFDPILLASTLAKEMTLFVIPNAPESALFLPFTDFSGTYQKLSVFEEGVQAVFLSLFSLVLPKFDKFKKLKTQGMDQDEAFSALLNSIEEMERLQELSTLVQRAKEKANNQGKPKDVILVPRPLKLLKEYQMSLRKRFTFF